LPATKIPTLREQASLFHERLTAVKKQTPLNPRVTWYPWPSLSQMAVLDEFLQSDSAALTNMIGRDPVLDVAAATGTSRSFSNLWACRSTLSIMRPPTTTIFWGYTR
jgi:hypothetical protein